MRVPTLFRVPRHTRFNYEPRYYDPIKDEIDQRVSLIKKELKSEENRDLRSNFRETYERKKKAGRKANANQIIVLTLVAGGAVGWLHYGSNALWILAIIFPVYIYFRIRGRV